MIVDTIKLGTIKLSPATRVATGTIHLRSYEVHEFFNQCHGRSDGKFCGGSAGGGGGGGGSGSKGQTAAKEDRSDTLKNIAVGLGLVTVSIGLAYAVHAKAPGSVGFSKAARHSAHLEGLLKKGGSDLDNAILDRKAKIAAGKNVDRNLRDLEVLENKGFLHEDDAAQFLRDLKKVDYSREERDALWDYGGVYTTKEEGTGLPLAFKGPVVRFNDKIRGRAEGEVIPMTRAELRTLKLVRQAIRKNKIPRDTTLYRTTFLHKDNVEELAKAKPGGIFRDPAPIYTGLTEKRAMPYVSNNRFPKEQKPVLFIIRAKKGTPAIHSPYGESVKGRSIPVPLQKGRGIVPDPLLKKQISVRVPFIEHLNKEEIVMQPNQGLKILSSHRRRDGVLVVEVETVK